MGRLVRGHTIVVNLTAAEKEWVAEQARAWGESMSSFIRGVLIGRHRLVVDESANDRKQRWWMS